MTWIFVAFIAVIYLLITGFFSSRLMKFSKGELKDD